MRMKMKTKKVTLHIPLDNDTMYEFEQMLDIPPNEGLVSVNITQDHSYFKQEWVIEIETVQQ